MKCCGGDKMCDTRLSTEEPYCGPVTTVFAAICCLIGVPWPTLCCILNPVDLRPKAVIDVQGAVDRQQALGQLSQTVDAGETEGVAITSAMPSELKYFDTNGDGIIDASEAGAIDADLNGGLDGAELSTAVLAVGELQMLSKKQLQKRAKSQGIDPALVTRAMTSAQPERMLIKLLVAADPSSISFEHTGLHRYSSARPPPAADTPPPAADMLHYRDK
jgi:hypothetical protein